MIYTNIEFLHLHIEAKPTTIIALCYSKLFEIYLGYVCYGLSSSPILEIDASHCGIKAFQ